MSASTVDHFIADMYPVADKLQARFADSFAVIAGGQEHAHDTPLIRLAHFARLHKDFFRDPDLDPLLAERWAGRRRTLSVASGLSAARSHRGSGVRLIEWGSSR